VQSGAYNLLIHHSSKTIFGIMTINKVEGPGGVRNSSPVKRTGKTGAAGSTTFAKHMEDEESIAPVSGVSTLGAVGGVGAILGVQEVGDATERAAKGRKRANMLLDQLDDLRIALINGVLSKEQLLRLSAMVQHEKVQIDDPRLSQILDDIDLRARVELAKYGF
jgi:hypothetical protein